jgi:hypothetical protein
MNESPDIIDIQAETIPPLYSFDGYACDGIENGCYLTNTPQGSRVGLPIGQTEDEADFIVAVEVFKQANGL